MNMISKRVRINSLLLAALILVLAGCDLAGLVGDADGDGSGSTTIAADTYEPDNAKSEATVLSTSGSGASPDWQEHTLHTSTDVDWFEIDVTATGNLYVSIAPVDGKDPSFGVEDIGFVLEDAGGTTLLEGITAFGNSTEDNVLTSGFSTGTHYIRVFAEDSSTGFYKISWYID